MVASNPSLPRKYTPTSFVESANSVVNDWNLSQRALGCYMRIQTMPDDWDFSITGLAETFSHGKPGKDGKNAISASVKELEEAGYLIRTQRRSEKGRLGTGVWVTIADLSIYDAVVEHLVSEGYHVTTERPARIDSVEQKAI